MTEPNGPGSISRLSGGTALLRRFERIEMMGGDALRRLERLEARIQRAEESLRDSTANLKAQINDLDCHIKALSADVQMLRDAKNQIELPIMWLKVIMGAILLGTIAFIAKVALGPIFFR